MGHHVESTHTTNLGMNVPSFGTHWIQHDQGEGGNTMRIFFGHNHTALQLEFQNN